MQLKSHRPAFMFPLAVLATALAAGILCSSFVELHLSIICSGAVLCFVSSAVAARFSRLVPTVIVIFGFFLSGATLALLEEQDSNPERVKQLMLAGVIGIGEPVELTGVLEREPEIAHDRRYLNIRVERIATRTGQKNALGSVLLLVSMGASGAENGFNQLDLHYGTRLRVMTLLNRSDKYRNPGGSSFTEYLDRKGYDATGLVKSPLLIERLDDEAIFLPLAWIYEYRRALQRQIDSKLSTDPAGVLDAAFLGNRYNLSQSTADHFRLSGTFHALVISGLHITFLGSLVFFLARRLTKKRLLQFLGSVSVVWAYSIAVGAEPSVVRAALMFSVVLLAPLVGRRAASLNALGGVALALLVYHPGELLDPSFQLTFVSVLAIVVFAWPMLKNMSEIGSWRPTREAPYPPACSEWLKNICEVIFWSESRSRDELERASYRYRLFKNPLAGTLQRMHVQSLVRYTFAAIVVSVSVQVVMLPFLVLYFHRISPASLVLNVTVSIMMTVVGLIAAVGLVVAQVSASAASPLFHAANSLNWLLINSVDPFEQAGIASVRVPEYAGWAFSAYVAYYLPLAVLGISLDRWRPLNAPGAEARGKRKLRSKIRTWTLLQSLAIALVLFHPLSAIRAEKTLRIDFLDVGQGDAALLTLPDNTTMLVDGGGNPGPFTSKSLEEQGDFEPDSRSIGEAVVSEYLWWRGLDHVDYLVATHADADHIDGLNDIVRNFNLRAALLARIPNQDPEYLKLSQSLMTAGVPPRLIGVGDEIRIGGVVIEVLWPPSSTSSELPSRNNDSVVIRLSYGSRSILMTGDIEAAAEKSLLVQETPIRSDVVKVAHHGSKTSSSPQFVTVVKPCFAVISVGQTSIFGHPNSEVLERWAGSGATVLTTGKCGTITITTDGTDLQVTSFVDGCSSA